MAEKHRKPAAIGDVCDQKGTIALYVKELEIDPKVALDPKEKLLDPAGPEWGN